MTKILFRKYIFLVRPFFFFYYFEENLVVWQKEEINLMHHVCFVQTSKFLWAETHTDWGIPPQIHWISSVLHNISDCGGNSGNAGTTSSVQSDGGASTAHMLPPSGWKLTSCIKWLNSRNLKLFLTSIQSNKCWYVSLFLNLLIKSDFFYKSDPQKRKSKVTPGTKQRLFTQRINSFPDKFLLLINKVVLNSNKALKMFQF